MLVMETGERERERGDIKHAPPPTPHAPRRQTLLLCGLKDGLQRGRQLQQLRLTAVQLLRQVVQQR